MPRSSVTSTNASHCVAALYDFDVHGGEVGAVPLRVRLPAGAIVVNSVLHVLDAPVSAGSATIAITLESAGDILAATAFDAPPFNGTLGLGLARYTPSTKVPDVGDVPVVIDDSAAAAFVVTTTERELTLTIGTAALTAGKLNVFLQYYLNTSA